MSEGLPTGWKTVALSKIADINPRHPKGLDDSMPVSFAPMAVVSESGPEFVSLEERPLGEVRKGFTHFAEGDVLFAKITPCMENGKGAVATGLRNRLGCGTTELHVIRPLAGVDPYYLYRFLSQRSIRRAAKENFTGTAGQLRVPSVFIEELAVPLAPLNEQSRIVAKVEKLVGKVDACQQRLAKIPVILKRFRQSILDAAVTGKLTADWRNESREPVSAKEDLKAFIEHKQNVIGTEKRVEPTQGHELLTEAVPDSWDVPSLGDLFKFIDYRGKTPKKSDQGKRLITAKNIRMGYIEEVPIEFVSEKYYVQWMTRGFPRKGDIFFVTEGATMGFVALNNRDDEFALAQRTIALQPFKPIDTRIFFFFMMSAHFQDLVRLNATGSAAVGIKAAKFRSLPIAFPPLVEQHEIVQRIEGLFALADQIEARFTKAKALVDQLTQSLLSKAFRGELVPQNPNDEPASVLLERIKAERTKGEIEAKGGGKKRLNVNRKGKSR